MGTEPFPTHHIMESDRRVCVCVCVCSFITHMAHTQHTIHTTIHTYNHTYTQPYIHTHTHTYIIFEYLLVIIEWKRGGKGFRGEPSMRATLSALLVRLYQRYECYSPMHTTMIESTKEEHRSCRKGRIRGPSSSSRETRRRRSFKVRVSPLPPHLLLPFPSSS